MRRRRLTWKDKRADSALPDEGYDHPAFIGQQPAEKYLLDNDGDGEAGTPSDFAEDVHQGPYDNGAEPALPHEEWDHPASVKQAARDIRASVERKAAKCIRIAQATLGKTASVADIENQALAFMDMPEKQLDSTLSRLSMYPMANEPEATMYAEEDSDLEEMMAEFLAEDDEDAEAEAMLAEMLKPSKEEVAMQSPMMADQNDPEHFMAEEEEATMPMAQEEEAMMPMADHHEDHDAGQHMSLHGEEGVMMSDDMDTMGLMGEEEMTAEDEDLLASIFGGRFAADEKEEKEAEEEKAEDEKEAEEEEKESSKKASYKLKPRARKASQGVKSVGNVSKTAKSEMDDLSKLWQTAPDISDMF